jgi:O-antigen/teichoic acid export membrane protein
VSSIDGKTGRGIAWIGVASSLVGVLDLVALVIVLGTGWITQAQYGLATIAIALFPVLDLATDLGLSGAVIQRDDHSREKISTVFWINVAMSVALCLVLALGIGPLLAHVYGQPVLMWMLVAYGGKLLFQNVYVIPHALMRRELRFKELSVLRVIANVGECAGKIGFAWAGLGVWAFVLGPLIRVFVTGLGVQLMLPWRPALVLRWTEARDWLVFGFRISTSRILFHLYSSADFYVVSYVFGPAANGVYTMAYNLVLQPAMVISEIVTQVAFPLFARIKHDSVRLIEQLIAFTRLNLVVMIAFIGVIFVATEPVFDFLEKTSPFAGLAELPSAAALPWLSALRFPVDDWSGAVPIARVLCLVAVLRALSFLIPPLLDGIGKPHLTLRYSVVASIVVPLSFVVFAVLLGDRLGSLSVAVAWTVSYPIAFTLLFAMTFTALEVPPMRFIRRIVRIPLWGAIALAAAGLVNWVDADLPSPVRFALTAGTMVAVFGGLLARFEGMSPIAVARALRDK